MLDNYKRRNFRKKGQLLFFLGSSLFLPQSIFVIAIGIIPTPVESCVLITQHHFPGYREISFFLYQRNDGKRKVMHTFKYTLKTAAVELCYSFCFFFHSRAFFQFFFLSFFLITSCRELRSIIFEFFFILSLKSRNFFIE